MSLLSFVTDPTTVTILLLKEVKPSDGLIASLAKILVIRDIEIGYLLSLVWLSLL